MELHVLSLIPARWPSGVAPLLALSAVSAVIALSCASRGASTNPSPGAAPASSQNPSAEPEHAGNAPTGNAGSASLEGGPASERAAARLDAGNGSRAIPEAAPAQPLPKGTTVLHIGDSMAGALGVALNAELKQAGLRGILRFKTASFIPTWAWGRDLPLYLAQYNPDLVLVTLGANEVAMFNPEQRARTVRKLVDRLEGRPCVWITPPLWAGDTGLLPVIRANCAPCRIMDSNAVFPEMPRVSDKIHPTIPARTEWAQRVVAWLAHERRPTSERPWQLAAESGEGLGD